MDRAAGLVAVELRQVERLGDDALAGEGGVAVDQQRHALARAPCRRPVLLGADAALDDRIDRLQVARVRRQRQVDRVARAADAIVGEAEVILHVAVAGHRVREVVVLELAEDFLVRLAEDVGEDVEPAAVGHAHDDLSTPLSAAVSTTRPAAG